MFQFYTRVTGIRTKDGRVTGIDLDGGEHMAVLVVVNAAGPYSSLLNKMAGVDGGMSISTRALRAEVCRLPRPKDLLPDGALSAKGGLVMLDGDVGSYFRTEQEGALLVGGTEPDCEPLVWIDDPDTLDRNPSQTWQNQTMRQALRLPIMGIPGQASGVVDMYDVSDDWIPIYDKSDLKGFYMTAGTSGNQFKNGPVAGQLMAGLVDYCESGQDHDRAPFQFSMPHTGLVLDTAAFSRRRSATASSTMNMFG